MAGINKATPYSIGIQGTQYSFSAQALKNFMGPQGHSVICHHTFDEAVKAFNHNAVVLEEYAAGNRTSNLNKTRRLFLPIFNSISRRVTAMDRWIPHLNGWIAGEEYLHVAQCLWMFEGVPFDQINEVWSMKPAIDQCWDNIGEMQKRYSTKNRKRWVIDYTEDTALAVRQLYKSGRRDVAAIGPSFACTGLSIFGFRIRDPNFCDNKKGYTHFIYIVPKGERDACLPDLKRNCITKIVLYGDLYPRLSTSIFQIFSDNDIRIVRNLEADEDTFRINSAIINLRGHAEAENVKQCFKQIKALKPRDGQKYQIDVKGCYLEKPRPV